MRNARAIKNYRECHIKEDENVGKKSINSKKKIKMILEKPVKMKISKEGPTCA